MVPVSPFENVMLKIGPARPVAAWVFDRPFGLETVLSGLAAACRRMPRLRKRLVERFGWGWWVGPDIAPAAILPDCVALIEDDALSSLDDLRRLMQKLERTGFPDNAPPWKAIIANPTGGGLAALVFCCDHSVADGIRIERMARNLDRWAIAEPLSPAALHALSENLPHLRLGDILARAEQAATPERDIGLAVAPAPILRFARYEDDAATALRVALASALAEPGILDVNRRLTGLALEITGERRSGSVEGNFVAARAVPMVPASARGDLPMQSRLLIASGSWRFAGAAWFPRFLVRKLIAYLYGRFDMVLALTPSTRRGVELGGAHATHIFGLAPFVGDAPAAITGILAGGHCCLSIRTGSAVNIPAAALADRVMAALAARASQRAVARTRESSAM